MNGSFPFGIRRTLAECAAFCPRLRLLARGSWAARAIFSARAAGGLAFRLGVLATAGASGSGASYASTGLFLACHFESLLDLFG